MIVTPNWMFLSTIK
jgi:hypothetical protein